MTKRRKKKSTRSSTSSQRKRQLSSKKRTSIGNSIMKDSKNSDLDVAWQMREFFSEEVLDATDLNEAFDYYQAKKKKGKK